MTQSARHVLITGANGFIGKNAQVRLSELPDQVVLTYQRDNTPADLPALVAQADCILHLAGENRPDDARAFADVNHGLTQILCATVAAELARTGRRVPLLLASSTQATQDNAYGRSKQAAEAEVRALHASTGIPIAIYRLPGVFGKWARPHYNSVVATFCHNIANGLPIEVHHPDTEIRLVYIDDVLTSFLQTLEDLAQPGQNRVHEIEVAPDYRIRLQDLADQIRAFEASRDTLLSERVGTGLTRALYATYVSYLPTARFAYPLVAHRDPRGVFVEMLKTPDCGQFSFFSAHPGVTRGGHYHHSKTEKFLVLRGEALFRFRHILTNATYEVRTSGTVPQVVETIPGWSHDITNIADEDMLVMLWANEIFDRNQPDTIASKV